MLEKYICYFTCAETGTDDGESDSDEPMQAMGKLQLASESITFSQ